MVSHAKEDELKPVEVKSLPGLLWLLFWPRGRSDIKVRVVIALTCLLAAKVAVVSIPVLFKFLVDSVSGEQQVLLAPVLVIMLYGLMRFVSVLLVQMRELVFVHVARSATRRLATIGMRKLHDLGQAYLIGRSVGATTQVVQNGVTGVRQILEYLVFNIVPTAVELIMIICVVWSFLELTLAATLLLSLVIYTLFTVVVSEWRAKHRRRVNEDFKSSKALLTDSLINAEAVQAYGRADVEAGRYYDVLARYERSSFISNLSLSFINLGQALIISIGLTILLIQTYVGVQGGRMTIGDFVLINGYILQVFQPLNMLGHVYRQIRNGFIDLDDLVKILKMEPAVMERPDADPLPAATGDVVFDKVSFGYDDRRILDQIDATFSKGKTTAIVGETGQGKTTIARLLLRFYDPRAGRITIGGHDIRNVTLESLRHNIGLVSQDTTLFNQSLRANIAFSKPDADEREIRRAISFAKLDATIMRLPDGLDTQVGERGSKLSGGERQRVSIARVFLLNPSILILDEATSALDSETEADILTSLAELSQSRTTIIIAHRLTTVRQADWIIVLGSDGRIVEEAQHDVLIAGRGQYYQFWIRSGAESHDVKEPGEADHG